MVVLRNETHFDFVGPSDPDFALNTRFSATFKRNQFNNLLDEHNEQYEHDKNCLTKPFEIITYRVYKL